MENRGRRCARRGREPPLRGEFRDRWARGVCLRLPFSAARYVSYSLVLVGRGQFAEFAPDGGRLAADGRACLVSWQVRALFAVRVRAAGARPAGAPGPRRGADTAEHRESGSARRGGGGIDGGRRLFPRECNAFSAVVEIPVSASVNCRAESSRKKGKRAGADRGRGRWCTQARGPWRRGAGRRGRGSGGGARRGGGAVVGSVQGEQVASAREGSDHAMGLRVGRALTGDCESKAGVLTCRILSTV
ncbi:hypothetical protein CLV63_107130 [Murinocardiopsis flavida]|uniref:Uncharacterized protein n=1 Tax=Murinocardiopsis flavida TaxID=645275 RepID=A0A2P8DKI0_9ACTN|nr:hypothetical protein CLV63_107130 [Murinocardiopsis flavida]